MKKGNLLLLASILVYLFLMMYSSYKLSHFHDRKEMAYQVEINRILYDLEHSSAISDIDLSTYSYVHDISFLSVKETAQENIRQFYTQEADHEIAIRPLFQEGTISGYVKFTYQIPKDFLVYSLRFIILSLTILECFFLVMFYWIRKQFLLPLRQLQTLPKHLSQGHLCQEVKEEKGSALNPFLLSVSQLSDDLQIAKKRRLELEKQKKQMVLSISHDIKTPLNLIQLYGKGILDEGTTKIDPKLAAENILIKTKEIERFIEEIVKTSREDILDIRVQMKEFYLSDFMQDIISIYQEQCEMRHMEFVVGPYENRLLTADSDRLQEVMENLFMNAFKYGDGKRIEITFHEEEYHPLIRVYNSGPLIKSQELPHVFDSFFRGTNSQGKSGSGLGLYICKEIMRKMEGDIFVRTEEGGMAFVLVLS